MRWAEDVILRAGHFRGGQREGRVREGREGGSGRGREGEMEGESGHERGEGGKEGEGDRGKLGIICTVQWGLTRTPCTRIVHAYVENT
jgi:hypothetical protein